MRSAVLKRCALYGCAAAVAVVLLVVGFATPDPGVDALMEPLFALARTDMPAAQAGVAALAERFPNTAKPALLAAFLADKSGDLHLAVRWYDTALQRCTDAAQRAEVLIALADLARRDGRSADATVLANQARSLAPKLARVRAFGVLQALDEGRCEVALKEARALAEEESGSPMAGRLCALAEAACRSRRGTSAEVQGDSPSVSPVGAVR